jgi:hypothetical protein
LCICVEFEKSKENKLTREHILPYNRTRGSLGYRHLNLRFSSFLKKKPGNPQPFKGKTLETMEDER